MIQPDPWDEIQIQAEQVAVHPWIKNFVRFGFAAKGVIYFVIGLLAAQVALGMGGETTDTDGALIKIVIQPFGKLLLCVLAVGLVGYVCWRLIQAIADPEHGGKLTAKRILQRIGYAMSGLTYAGVSLTAFKLLVNFGYHNGDAAKDWAAHLLNQPFGELLVGLGGIAVVGIGLSYLYGAYTANSIVEFKAAIMHPTLRLWAIQIGQFGIAARGIVFVVIGNLLLKAALLSDSNQAEGLGGALRTLARPPFGRWVLGVVAFGFMAYALYMLLAARYRRFAIAPSPLDRVKSPPQSGF